MLVALMEENGLRIAVVVVDLFLALSAIVGAIGLVVGFMNIPLCFGATTLGHLRARGCGLGGGDAAGGVPAWSCPAPPPRYGEGGSVPDAMGHGEAPDGRGAPGAGGTDSLGLGVWPSHQYGAECSGTR